ncbi:LysM peptidoglycan-binding domain-containing protein [Kingella oralis]|uniref:LysM peptidoglycan-binding domain-containing protein n=1 Tax=Kingella oralis TaxID=505 RepID=UPI0034E56EC9
MKLRSILTLATAAALLTACSAAKNSAPVVAGNGVGGSSTASPYTPSTATPYDNAGATGNASNPYGAAPYTPTPSTVYNPSTGAAPYTPAAPAPTTSAYSNPTGVYPSVDVNATHHQVVSGDTLYNIAKRYGVSQDNIRAWNNMPDDTVKLGTSLRVKPHSASGTSYGNGSTATGSYRVVSGDTLYSIAQRHGMTVSQLRAVNHLQDENLRVGQTLRVTGTAVASTPVVQPTPVVTTTTTTSVTTTPTISAPTITASGKTASHAGLTWQSPLAGASVSKAFSSSTRGVELQGAASQTVVAAADGQVIFSGNGPRGYGKLVVVQHSPNLLTAYSGSENLIVKEQERVKRGQSLARMGSAGKLHFEVRENGTPVNPSNYIPF